MSERPSTPSSPPKRTPEEESILRAVARSAGSDYVSKNAEMILEQARRFGDL